MSEIRTMLENHEDIESDETLIVNFLAFNASSLDIMVYTFTKTTQWVKFHEVKQDVLLKISDIIESHGAEVAFPTRTLHVADSVRLASAQSERSDQADNDSDDGPIENDDEGSDKSHPSQRTRYGSSAEATGDGD